MYFVVGNDDERICASSATASNSRILINKMPTIHLPRGIRDRLLNNWRGHQEVIGYTVAHKRGQILEILYVRNIPSVCN